MWIFHRACLNLREVRNGKRRRGLSSHFTFLKALIPLFILFTLTVCYLITSISSSLTQHAMSHRLLNLRASLHLEAAVVRPCFLLSQTWSTSLSKPNTLLLRLSSTLDAFSLCVVPPCSSSPSPMLMTLHSVLRFTTVFAETCPYCVCF